MAVKPKVVLSRVEKAEQARLAGKKNRSDAETYRLRQLIEKEQGGTGMQPKGRATKGSTTPGPGFGLRAAEAEAAASAPVFDPSDPNQVRWVQQVLKDAGFDPGPIDGRWGPRTEAANAAWTAAGKPGPLEPAVGSDSAAGMFDVGGGLGGGGGAAASGVPAVPTYTAPARPSAASLTPNEFRTRVLTELPAYAAFLDIPDLVPIIQARLDNAISTDEFGARVKQTSWYRTTPERTRVWMGLYAIDPATANRQIDEQAAAVKRAAGSYFVPMADVTAREWSKKVLSGEVPEAAFTQYLKEQAKSIFPALAGAIDAGVTVEQYADPYKQVTAQTLEISPDQINFNEPKWGRALMAIAKDGTRTSMSLYDWQNLIKTDPAYGYDNTNQARTQATQISERIAQTFGKVG